MVYDSEFLKVAWRNLLKEQGIRLINISGLASWPVSS